MARTHARLYMSIWAGDFRLLTKDAQRLYVVLITQAEINNCGVLPFVERKWARLAVDETMEELEAALALLIDRRFIIVDQETDELLVRTYIRHDRVERVPQLAEAAKREFPQIASRRIRKTLHDEYPSLFAELATPELLEPLPEPLFDTSPDLSTDTSPDTSADTSLAHATRGHTRAPAPSPTPAPTPEVRDEEAVEPSRATQANGLPIEKERHVTSLLTTIGTDADDGTPGVIRAYARRLPEGALAKVLESVQQQKPDDRAAYVVAALKDELPADPGSSIAKLEREPEAYVRQLGFKLPDDLLEEKLEQLVPDDADERIRLHDLAADLRSAAA